MVDMVVTGVSSKPKTVGFSSAEEPWEVDQQLDTKKSQSRCCRRQFWWSLIKLVTLTALLVFFGFAFSIQVLILDDERNGEGSEVRIYVVRPTEVTFPAITVCNNKNGIQKSKFCQKYPHHCTEETDNKTTRIATSTIARYLQNRLPPREAVKLGQTWQEFVPKCVRVVGDEKIDCRTATNIYGPEMTCFTFLRESEQLVGNHKKAGFAMTLNFQPEENVEATFPIGGQLFVHDQLEIFPDGFPLSTNQLKPGMMYSVLIKQKTYYRRDYTTNYQCEYYSSGFPYTSKQECLNTCLRERFTNSCGCVPEFVPWIETGQDLSYCSGSTVSRRCVKAEGPEIEQICDSLCPVPCIEIKYKVKVIASEMPNLNEDFEEANKQLANVWIKYETNEEVVYAWNNFFSLEVTTRIYLTCLYCLTVLALLFLTVKAVRAVYRSLKADYDK